MGLKVFAFVDQQDPLPGARVESIVVLAAWATWCRPCLWELPEIERAYQRFAGNRHVVFLSVDRGSAEETPARATGYFKKTRLSIPLAFEDAGFAAVLDSDALPVVVVLDRQGRMRFVHHGYDASEHLDDLLSRTIGQLLDEPER